VKTIRLSSASRPLTSYAAEFRNEVLVLTERNRPVAAVVPLKGIDRESLERLAAFNWPGNIRQLQNVIEHSAILCDDDMLRVPPVLVVEKQPGVRSTSRLDTTLHHNEQELIEQALEETAGRVSGPSGAAARLGVPSSTLESKIRRFKIHKLRYHLTSA